MLNFLKADYPLQQQIYLVPRYILRYIGFETKANKSKRQNVWALLNYTILAYGSCARVFYFTTHLSVEVEVELDALSVATVVMALIKVFFGWRHCVDWIYLMQHVTTLANKQQGVNKTAVKRKFVQLATKLSAFFCFFSVVTIVTYLTRTFLTNMLHFVSGDALLWETPYRLSLPAPMLSMPYYTVTNLLKCWFSINGIFGFAGVDTFLLASCFYFRALLKCFQTDLLELHSMLLSEVPTEEKDGLSEDDETEIYEKLCNIIQCHTEIADLVELFTKIMVGSTLPPAL